MQQFDTVLRYPNNKTGCEMPPNRSANTDVPRGARAGDGAPVSSFR